MGDDSFWPEMPRFRQPNGRMDWRQVADMFIPGNVWNSRTDEWRPRGVAAGVASTAFGPLAGALVENSDRFRMPRMPDFSNPLQGLGNWISGRTGRSTMPDFSGSFGRISDDAARRGVMPDFSGSFGRISNDAANTPVRNRDAINRQNSRVVREAQDAPVSNINDFRRGGSRPRLSRGGSGGGGNMGGVTLGLGQLGRGGDEALAAASRSMYDRRGTQIEQ